MAEDQIYLTVDTNPNGPGLVAVMTQGQPQLGDEHCVVLSLELVKNMKEAKIWFRRMKVERPWELRN